MRRRSVIWVTAAKAIGPFRLWLRFSDGSEGEADLAEFVATDSRPIVAALRNPVAFAALRVDFDTVVWDNGFDLAPEFLRAQIKPPVSV
jgi:hypothetical protein